MSTPSLEAASPPLVFNEPPVSGRSFGGSRLLFRSAAEEFGVQLTTQEYYDWLVELEAAMLIDHLVDVERKDVPPHFHEIVSGKFRDDLAADIQIRAVNYMGRQPGEYREQIYTWVEEVNDLAVAQQNASKPGDVVDINVREAEILAALLALKFDDTSDEQARQNFNNWLRGWSRTGYLLDVLVDMKSDFESGESGVRPSAFAAAHYATALAGESITSMAKTPPALIGKCALVGMNYVIRGKRRDVRTADH